MGGEGLGVEVGQGVVRQVQGVQVRLLIAGRRVRVGEEVALVGAKLVVVKLKDLEREKRNCKIRALKKKFWFFSLLSSRIFFKDTSKR